MHLLVNDVLMQYNKNNGCVHMKRIIENVKFMLDGTMVFGDLHLENGIVERIDYKTPHMMSDIAIPGLVDIHTHGFHGLTCESTDKKHLHLLAKEYAKRGITSFCPTIRANSLSVYKSFLDAYRKAFRGDYRGARYEGVHLEGPYLHPDQCGAIKKENLQDIHLGELEDFLSEYHDDIRIMTIAPELPNAMEAISLLHLYGVEVSLGHTNADYAQTLQAFEKGATQITHLGNTMPGIDSSKPGIMDAAFLSNCLCEIIVDGVHIQKEMLRWLIQLLGTNRVVAVSDGTLFSGFTYPNGYKLKDGSVVKNGAVYKDDILLGSIHDLLDIFQFLYEKLEYDLSSCIQMCSTNAAKMLKSYSYEIGLGRRINLVVLSHDFQIKDVIINGRSMV